MAKYRRKTVSFVAHQWFPGTDVPGVCAGPCPRTGFEGTCAPHVHTMQRDTTVWVHPGDWIVQERDGVHWYTCQAEVFADTYEPVE
jgi:hypothetical protein